MPQLAASLFKSTQAAPQVVLAQVAEQTEFEQKGAVAGQTMPHMPQLVALDLVSMQTPLHMVPAHCAGAPPKLCPPLPFGALPLAPALRPPVPLGALPLPPVPWSPGVEFDEQLMARSAVHPSVSEAPTNFARNELDFGRNRFHIRTPNLVKVRKGSGATPPRRNSLASLCSHCSASKRKGKLAEINALAETAVERLALRARWVKNSSKLPTNLFRDRLRVALSGQM